MSNITERCNPNNYLFSLEDNGRACTAAKMSFNLKTQLKTQLRGQLLKEACTELLNTLPYSAYDATIVNKVFIVMCCL